MVVVELVVVLFVCVCFGLGRKDPVTGLKGGKGAQGTQKKQGIPQQFLTFCVS